MPDSMLDDPTIVGIAALAVLAVVLILYMARGRGQDLAGALERRGWLLYVRDGCGYCTQQKDMFKNGFRAIVKCGAPPPPGAALPPVVGAPPTCQDPRITGFPYWFNTQTGVSKVGLQNLNALRQMAH